MKTTQKFDSFSNVQIEKFIFVKILTSEKMNIVEMQLAIIYKSPVDNLLVYFLNHFLN